MKPLLGQFPKPRIIGQCIYCRSTTPPLEKEHIIPYSLNGDYVLKQACCKKCHDKINAFETVCTSKIFYNLRIAQEFRHSRKHKKPRPKFLPITLVKNGVPEESMVPSQEYPVLPMRFPMLPGPGMMVGIPPASEYLYVPYSLIMPKHVAFNKWEEKLKSERAEAFSIEDKFEIRPFLRLLAKIAHGFAIYVHGMDGFDHLLPKYILGDDDKILFVVGTSGRPEDYGPNEADSKNKSGHMWRTGMFTPDNPDDPRFLGEKRATYVVTDVQLFRNWGAPVYEIVAGKLLKPVKL